MKERMAERISNALEIVTEDLQCRLYTDTTDKEPWHNALEATVGLVIVTTVALLVVLYTTSRACAITFKAWRDKKHHNEDPFA